MKAEKMIANGWTADLPEGWEDRSMITLVGATDSKGFAPNIVVTREKITRETKIEDYAAAQAEMMRRELGGGGAAAAALQILDERAIEINNIAAFQRLQRFMIDGGQVIQQVQTFFLGGGGGIIYTVTGTASLESFDQSIPAFKKFVETFKLAQR